MNDKLDKQWVRGTIFYDRRSWQELLGEAIFPFIEREKKLIDVYFMRFEASPRDHIKLTLKSVESNNTKLENLFLDFMDQYLLDNPSNASHSHHRFYPNNTAWANQYDENDFYLAGDERNFSYIRERIANTFRVLIYDSIDTSSMYTLIFYLQLGLLKTFQPEVNEIKNEVDKLITYLSHDYNAPKKFVNSTTQKIGRQFFSHNKQILTEIIDDIWGDLNYKQNLYWLAEWTESCKYSIKDLGFNNAFVLISRLIYDSLGLMSNKLLPLSLQIMRSALIDRNKCYTLK